ncbi:MAG TPA: hypothetical protein V6D28_11685 [Leptolyngbyaceae cyanobacterium]
MSQPNLLELAKQGNPKAIATLLNRSLQPKGITVKASLKNDCLQLMLESEQIPDRQELVPFIRKGLTNLQAGSICNVKIYGQQIGMASPSWHEKFDLEKQQPSLTNSDEIETAMIYKPAEKEPNEVKEVASHKNSVNYHSSGIQKYSKPLEENNTQKITYKDVLEGLRIFFTNPVGGLPTFFASLGKPRALAVGGAFGLIYLICVLLVSLQNTQTPFIEYLGGYKIVMLCLIQFASILGASALTRKLFRGKGSFEGDVFIAGSSLLAPGFYWLLAINLGIANIEIIVGLTIICCIYTILTLYTGCHNISEISESKSPLAVSCMLIASIWLSKIMVSSFLSR